MRTTLALALLFLSALAMADETGRPSGANCSLAAPPETAGEESVQGVTLRIFPRARDLGDKYTGCQVRWAADKDRWSLAGAVWIASGEPIRLWSPEVSVVTCLYDKGKLIQGDAKSCPDQQSLVLKSLAPGCLEKIRRTVAQGGNAKPHIAGCDPE